MTIVNSLAVGHGDVVYIRHALRNTDLRVVKKIPETLMSDNSGERGKSGVNVDVAIGKELDRSLADIVRALFVPPATEIGNLLGDAIGLASDRIRRKRELNAKLGMREVHKQLDQAGVSLDDIVPPKEEDLHLLITGLSLTDDGHVRKLWAGLFANALGPNSGVSADRPYLSVLQSLSPMDAKIIDFLAFALQSDLDLKMAPRAAMPKDFQNPTEEEREEIRDFQKRAAERAKDAIEAIKARASEYGLNAIAGNAWADNLLRQGVLQRAPVQVPHVGDLQLRSLDERGLMQLVQNMAEKIHIMEELAKHSNTAPKMLFANNHLPGPINLGVVLTPFGRRLAHACGLMTDPEALI